MSGDLTHHRGSLGGFARKAGSEIPLMGMDHKVSFRREKTPSWAQLKEALASRNLSLELRMIDGELAFPDETPPDTWRELRVGTPSGMITLRREIDGVTLVIWGNADENLRRDWNTLADVLRELVET